MHYDDTIVAISSPAAPAARIIVRLTGRGAIAIARNVCPQVQDQPASARRLGMSVGDLEFPAWVYVFRGPRSYTGEDLIELHIPGNPILARMLLEALMKAGARAAGPGEFTARAVFNGRMDLSAAEGVAAVISAAGERELQAARQLLSGQLARRVRPILDEIATTLALVEVGIDFADEDVTVLSESDLRSRVGAAAVALNDLLAGTSRMERLRHEPRVVLVGRPNAGKSTLLNALAGTQRAVVSDTPGTTRDALTAPVDLPRGRIQVIDLAGLDPAVPASTDSAIAADMQRRAREELEAADVVVLVQDCTDPSPAPDLPRPPDLVLLSKADLRPSSLPRYRGRGEENSPANSPAPADGLAISAHTGEGLPDLRRLLDDRSFGGPTSPVLALNSRHVRAVEGAVHALGQVAALNQSELIALHLRDALDSLGTILGQVTPDEILGRIFSQFCIGK